MKKIWNRALPKFPIIHIYFAKNNTFICVTNKYGESLRWKSCGLLGFKNANKKKLLSVQATVKAMIDTLVNEKVTNIILKIRGFTMHRETSVEEFLLDHFQVVKIIDGTRMPYNGCRPPRTRNKFRKNDKDAQDNTTEDDASDQVAEFLE